MTPERWQQIEQLYHAALEREAGARAGFLAESCAGDEDLLTEVETLLAEEQQAATFIEKPALHLAAHVLAAEQNHPMVGAMVGCYQILSLLGTGGMGEVFRALDTSLGREVAVKLLLPAFSRDPDRVRRFEQEARAAGMLNHPNILTIYAVGNHEGCPYLVSELLEGETLRDRLGGNALPPLKAVDYALQMVRGLAAAHEKRIVHRDLKPENLFITKDGRVKILDFGLAKLTQPVAGGHDQARTESGTIMGTAGYMSPEQVRGQTADHRADIFSLGVILYEMLSGNRPFQRDSLVESMNAILHEKPPRLSQAAPDAPPALERIVWRCIEKSPEERFQSASDLGFAIEALSGIAVPVAGTALQPMPRPHRRKRLVWAAVLALLSIAAVGVSLKLTNQSRAVNGLRLSTGAPASKNSEANEYFEKAMLFIRIQNDLLQGRLMLERGLQIDRHFAEARRWYGFTHAMMIDGGHSNDTTWLYKAEEDLRQALKDDPNLASVHSALAAVYLHQGRKELVPLEVEKCLKAEPDDPEALSWLIEYHRLNGENTEALALTRPLIKREPLFFPARMSLGEVLRTQGDTAGAIREQEKILEQSPNNTYGIWFLSRAYLDAGELAKARGVLEHGRSIASNNFAIRMQFALLLLLEGKQEAALGEMNEEVLKFAAANVFTTSEAAGFYSVLKQTSKALDWLERAVRNGDDRAEWFRRDPLLSNIRGEPRFQQIVDSVAYRRRAPK